MNFARTAISAAALFLAIGINGTLAADASVPANSLGCLDMAKKARAALDAGQQSQNYDAAQAQAIAAREFCSAQRYQEGIDRYANVLKLLGAG